ncbi:MAG: nicotinamide-nucleotide amidohydrolase family protein, partial [Actinobacteria bacterium]|nr:nicotinamide-nucleotide amidohydrolase family protein [Actinomycetota bacterium]
RAILPDLLARSGEPRKIASRVLRTWGESESGLNERLQPLIDELDRVGNPTLAFLASGWEGIKVRLTARGADDASVKSLLDSWAERVRAIVPEVVFGYDTDTMESVVLDLLRAQGLTIGVAESVTGGLVAGRLTATPGSSDVMRGGVVAYASDVKFDVLGVPRGPVISEDTARAMAVGVCKTVGSSVGLALTGVAGPAEQDGATRRQFDHRDVARRPQDHARTRRDQRPQLPAPTATAALSPAQGPTPKRCKPHPAWLSSIV